MAHSNYVHIEVEEILGETAKAFRIRLEDGEEAWLPKSQMAEPDSYRPGDRNVTLSITEWIAQQKGWGE